MKWLALHYVINSLAHVLWIAFAACMSGGQDTIMCTINDFKNLLYWIHTTQGWLNIIVCSHHHHKLKKFVATLSHYFNALFFLMKPISIWRYQLIPFDSYCCYCWIFVVFLPSLKILHKTYLHVYHLIIFTVFIHITNSQSQTFSGVELSIFIHIAWLITVCC